MSTNVLSIESAEKHAISDELHDFLLLNGITGIGKTVLGYAIGANDDFALFISPVTVKSRSGNRYSYTAWQMRLKVFDTKSREDRIRKTLNADNPSDAYLEAMSKLAGYCKAYGFSPELTVINDASYLPAISKSKDEINYLTALPLFDNVDMDVLLPKATPDRKKVKRRRISKKMATRIMPHTFRLTDEIKETVKAHGLKLYKTDADRHSLLIAIDSMHSYQLYQHFLNGFAGYWELRTTDKNGTRISMDALANSQTLDDALKIAAVLIKKIRKLEGITDPLVQFNCKDQYVIAPESK